MISKYLAGIRQSGGACFFKYRLKQRDNTARKMIVTNLFLQRLQYFRVQIPRVWRGGK